MDRIDFSIPDKKTKKKQKLHVLKKTSSTHPQCLSRNVKCRTRRYCSFLFGPPLLAMVYFFIIKLNSLQMKWVQHRMPQKKFHLQIHAPAKSLFSEETVKKWVSEWVTMAWGDTWTAGGSVGSSLSKQKTYWCLSSS